MSTVTLGFDQLPEAGEVKKGDFFVIEDLVQAKKINYSNIIFGLDNVTFASTISAQSTDIAFLSASVDSLSSQSVDQYTGLLDLISTTVTTTTANFVNILYPVGTVIYTNNATNPGNLIYNTVWTQVAQGLFIAGVGAGVDKNGNGFTVGVENAPGNFNVGEYQHKLLASEIPAHTHDVILRLNDSGSTSGYQNGPQASPAMRLDNNTSYTSTANTPADGYHNNIPPLYGLYAWKRIG